MELCVRTIAGRYPSRRAVLSSANITATVTSHDGTCFRIRLDDDSHPDAWLEILVELYAAPLLTEHDHLVSSGH